MENAIQAIVDRAVGEAKFDILGAISAQAGKRR